jgi:hypothetical protein
MPELFKEVNEESTETNEDSNLELNKKIEELKDKSPEELAKGKAHADMFIDFLKEQNKNLKEELDKRVNAEDLLKELKETRTKEDTKVSEEPTGSGLKPEDIESLVQKSLKNASEKEIATRNVSLVDAKVRETYGDKAEEFIKSKAKELGLGLQYLGDVAARSPVAFFNLVGLDKGNTTPFEPTKSTVNTEAAFSSSNNTPGTNKHYTELRKKDPRKFYSPQVQKQMFEDRKRLGEKFYN